MHLKGLFLSFLGRGSTCFKDLPRVFVGLQRLRPCYVTAGCQVPPDPGSHSSASPSTHSPSTLSPICFHTWGSCWGAPLGSMQLRWHSISSDQCLLVYSPREADAVTVVWVQWEEGDGGSRLKHVFWDRQHLVLKYLGFIPSHPCSSARSSWGHHRSRDYGCLFVFYRKRHREGQSPEPQRTRCRRNVRMVKQSHTRARTHTINPCLFKVSRTCSRYYLQIFWSS